MVMERGNVRACARERACVTTKACSKFIHLSPSCHPQQPRVVLLPWSPPPPCPFSRRRCRLRWAPQPLRVPNHRRRHRPSHPLPPPPWRPAHPRPGPGRPRPRRPGPEECVERGWAREGVEGPGWEKEGRAVEESVPPSLDTHHLLQRGPHRRRCRRGETGSQAGGCDARFRGGSAHGALRERFFRAC